MINKHNISQILLALAITFLAFSLVKIANEVPGILNTIDKTSPQVDVIVDEVALIRQEVKLVRLLLAKQTPEVLAKVADTLPVIREVLAESERYLRQLPTALEKVDILTRDVQRFKSSLPNVLQRIDAVVDAMNTTVNEVALWRPYSREYLTEIALSRENIPQYLTRAENIVIDAKSIGKEASSGIVTGFLKGVISLPFEVVSGLAGMVDSDSQSAKYLTAADVNLMQEKVIALLSSEKRTRTVWQNVDSGNRGIILKGKLIRKNQQNCHKLTFNNFFAQGIEESLKELMCLDEEGLWEVM